MSFAANSSRIMPKPSLAVYLWLILSGFAVGVWSLFSPGTSLVLCLTLVLFYVLNLSLKGYPDRKIIMTVCAVAISLRFALAIVNYYGSYSKGIGADFVGDARAYSGSGQYIAEVITGKPMPNIDNNEKNWGIWLRDTYKGAIPDGGYRIDYFSRYIGMIYSLLGYDPIAVKLLNSFLSVFTAVLLFFLLKEMFSIKPARLVLFLTIFWPSLFLWSVTGTKDALTIFLIALILYIFCRLRKSISFLEYLLVIALLAVNNYVKITVFLSAILLIRTASAFFLKRDKFFFVIVPTILILVMKIAADTLSAVRLHIALPLLIALFLSSVSFLTKKRLAFLFVVMLCLGLFLPVYLQRSGIDIDKFFVNYTQKTIDLQRAQLFEANTGYRVYPERFYDMDHPAPAPLSLMELALSYARGMAYSLFSPFPWDIQNESILFYYVQMPLYYLLMPFTFLGLLLAFRYRWRDILPLAVFMFIVASMYALCEGNIGTLARHRDILIILFLPLGAIGISKALGILTAAYPE